MTDRKRWQQQAEGGYDRRQPVILNAPGLGNSSPDHLQSRLERRYPWFQRADLGQSDRPDRLFWTQKLDERIRGAGAPGTRLAAG